MNQLNYRYSIFPPLSREGKMYVDFDSETHMKPS